MTSQTQKAQGGRPRKTGARVVRPQVRFPAEMLVAVEEAARRYGMSFDGWVRDACAMKLARVPGDT